MFTNVLALSLLILFLGANPSLAGPSAQTRASILFQLATDNSQKPAKRNLALRQIDEAIALDPQNASFYYLKGLILADINSDEAIRNLDKALSIDPKNGQAWNKKSEILFRQNKPESALKAADKAMACSQSYLGVRIRPLQKLHRYDEALKESELFLRKFPDNDVIRTLHSDMAKELKRWSIVTKDETELIAMKKNDPKAYSSNLRRRAEAHMAMHQDKKAIADLQQAVQTLPTNMKAHKLLLELYEKKGDKKNVAKERAILADYERKFNLH